MTTKSEFFVLAWLCATVLTLFGQAVTPTPVQVRNFKSVDDIVKLVDGLEASFSLATVKKVAPHVLLIVPRPGKALTGTAVTELQNAIQAWDQASSGGVSPVPVQIQHLSNVDDIVKLVDGLSTTFTTATVKKIGNRALLIVPRNEQTLTATDVVDLQNAITSWDKAARQAVAPQSVRIRNLPIDDTVKLVEGSIQSFPAATVKKLDANTLVVVPRGGRTLTLQAVADLRRAIEGWDRRSSPNPTQGGPRVIQLFHLRSAPAIVTALTPALEGGVKLKSIGNDQLVIVGGHSGNGSVVRRVRQLIAVLDQPRPQSTMQLWTLPVSDRNSQVIQNKFERARALIREHDEVLRELYAVAWREVSTLAGTATFFDPALHHYVSDLYSTQTSGCRLPDIYCLGYDLSLEGAPSLSRMLILLALSDNPWRNTETVFTALKREVVSKGLLLDRTQEELNRLFTGGNLTSLQAAILDYLFHYKWSRMYPRRFSPHNHYCPVNDSLASGT